eukprot:4067119-Prymnesium_polylepis.1
MHLRAASLRCISALHPQLHLVYNLADVSPSCNDELISELMSEMHLRDASRRPAPEIALG